MTTSEPTRSRLFFISHKSEDKKRVSRLAVLLEHAGHRSWLDQTHLLPDADFASQIDVALQEATGAIVALGPSGLGPYQALEVKVLLERHERERIAIAPIKLPGAHDANVPPELARFTSIDLTHGVEGAGVQAHLLFRLTGDAAHLAELRALEAGKYLNARAHPSRDQRAFLADVLGKVARDLRPAGGGWTFRYGGAYFALAADPTHDQMRLFTVVAAEQQFGDGQLEAMLEANFRSSHEAKYALNRGKVLAVFCHRLSDLSEEMLLSGLSQVMQLLLTFGTSYEGTHVHFESDNDYNT
jgi:hypothetical protein